MLFKEITTAQIMIMIIKEEELIKIITTNKSITKMSKITMNNKNYIRKNRGKTGRKGIGRTNIKDRENKDKNRNLKEDDKPQKQGQPKEARCLYSHNETG